MEIEPPYDFPKLHGCLPAYCTCPNFTGALKAPPADLYLNPVKKALSVELREEVVLVNHFMHLLQIESRA